MTLLELLRGNCGLLKWNNLFGDLTRSLTYELTLTSQMEELSSIVNLNGFTPLQGQDGADNSSKTVSGP